MKRRSVAILVGLFTGALALVSGSATAPAGAEPTAGASAAAATAQWAHLGGREGFWRVGRDAAGTWWFVSPDGTPEFLNTVTTVVPRQGARDRGGAEFTSTDWDPTLPESERVNLWAAATVRRVKDAGFKGLGAWCHPGLHGQDVPMARDLNLAACVSPTNRRVFSPGWAADIEAGVRRQVEPLRDNRNLVGYYLDNELDWGDWSVGPWCYFDDLPQGDPNRQEVAAAVRSLWGSVEDFNRDWHADLKDWSDLETLPRLPRGSQAAYEKLYSAFLSRVALHYFRVTTALVRQHDPNHLILGIRFRGFAPPEVVRASRGYTDAQSINYYPADAKLDREMFRMMTESSGQPVIVSEFAFHALDGRSGNRNTVGFIAQVPDQQARADGYRLLTSRLARVPYVIGADWFQWMDEPPSGRGHDGEDVNFGIVDIDDRPYESLVQAVRETTPLLNGLHGGSAAGPQDDVWRDGAYPRPAAAAPFLDKPVRVNGELSDWPATAKITGVRPTGTVGLERLSVSAPNVYLGWTPEGVYVGLEVFDGDVLASAAAGNWWMRDSVELFVAGRAVPDSQAGYDANCHSFFFLPSEATGLQGRSGAVGQWDRKGDGLRASVSSHPDIRHAARVLRDRYVLEMFIPAKSLTGFDPAKHPAIAFNLHARNFQNAAEYFWSAPKEAQTHLRPNTWGRVALLPPGGTPAAAPLESPVAGTDTSEIAQ